MYSVHIHLQIYNIIALWLDALNVIIEEGKECMLKVENNC